MIQLAMAAALLVQDPDQPPDCCEPLTTLDMNECRAEDLRLETARMEAYLNAAFRHVRDEAKEAGDDALAADSVVEEIRKSQTLWQAYADRACSAVYTRWQAGTIRVLMALDCSINLTRQRTHHLWTEYLSFPDGTPPLLPEPAKTVAEELSGA